MASRHHRWCFTIWINTEERLLQRDPNDLYKFLTSDSQQHTVRFFIYQLEVSKNDELHIQGYIELREHKTKSAIIKYLDFRGYSKDGITVKISRGTAEQNIAYCSKEFSKKGYKTQVDKEMIYKWGIPAKESVDNLIPFKYRDLLQGIKEGNITRQMIIENVDYFQIYSQYASRIDEYLNYYQKKVRTQPKVICYWGYAGTGKTSQAYKECLGLVSERDIYLHTATKWWDGYFGQHVAIIDDYNGEIEFTLFLKMLNYLNVPNEKKGSFIIHNCELIYITSNTHPKTWYINQNISLERMPALARRIDIIKYFPKESQLVSCDWNDVNFPSDYGDDKLEEKELENVPFYQLSISNQEKRLLSKLN